MRKKITLYLHKFLMIVSLSLYVISIFLPWMIEHGFIPDIQAPPFSNVSYVGRFWSFQVLIDYFKGNFFIHLIEWRFQVYWSLVADARFQGWLFVLVFQILGVVFGATSVVKEKVKGKPLPPICAIACLILTLVLGYFQLAKPLAIGDRARLSVSIGVGFFLALTSVILWLVSLLIDKIVEGMRSRAFFWIFP